MLVRRHGAAGIDPNLDLQFLAAAVGDGPPEAQPLPQDRVLDHLLLRVAFLVRSSNRYRAGAGRSGNVRVDASPIRSKPPTESG
jgi:hypothetical protein